MEAEQSEARLDLAPFSISQLQEDLLEVFYHHLQSIGRLVGAEAAWALISKEPMEAYSFQFLDPEQSAKNLGLDFSMIEHTNFAQSMINLYNYAYFAQLDTAMQKPEGESEYVWFTTLCLDAADGATSNERFDYGSSVSLHANRCVQVAETANARNMLEGEEPFYYFHGGSNKESSIDFEGLTIRQLALLSGMEEGSVRAATNPKRVKPLVTFKSGNRTLINFDVAKAWLMDKGRYLPVKYYRSSTEVDWQLEEINGVAQFNSLLARQVSNVVSKVGIAEATQLFDALEKKGVPLDFGGSIFSGQLISLTEKQMSDTTLMHSLAKIIQVDPEIFVLRATEVVLLANLEKVTEKRKKLFKDFLEK